MKAKNLFSSPLFLWCIFILFSVWSIISAIQHEPCGDEYHVWRMVRDLSLSELWSAMSSEGHFIPWHLLQWPFVKWFGMDYHCIYIVSVSSMILAAWLMIFKLEFNIWGKILVLFSAPFCYYFPVVARCYALIPPILVGIAILYQKKEKPYLYCLLLGLLANTHAYMEGLVAVLWCLFVYNQVIVLYKRNPKQAMRNLYASLITILLVLVAFIQVVGGLINVEHGINPPGEGKNTPEMWFSIFNGGNQFKSFYTMHRHIRLIPKLDVLATIMLWIGVVIGCYEHIKESKQVKWQMVCILFFGIAWQIFFACNIYGMNCQRIHLPYFIIVFVLWITYEKHTSKWAFIALLAFWLLNTSSQYVIVKDLYTSQGNDAMTAKQYDSLMIHDAPCYTDYLVGVNDLMEHKFQFTRFDISDTAATDQALSEFTQESGDCYVLIMAPIKVSDGKWEIDSLVTLNNIEYGYHLYYIKKNE